MRSRQRQAQRAIFQRPDFLLFEVLRKPAAASSSAAIKICRTALSHEALPDGQELSRPALSLLEISHRPLRSSCVKPVRGEISRGSASCAA